MPNKACDYIPNKYIDMKNILFVVMVAIFITACSNDQTVYAYVVVKPTHEDAAVSEWRPVMRVTYRISDNNVISEVAGLLDEYQDCTVQDKYNWECRYQDDRGDNFFGFKDGKYWDQPGWGDDIKHVSRWEYNKIRCKWYQHDNGKFKGIMSCLQTYI